MEPDLVGADEAETLAEKHEERLGHETRAEEPNFNGEILFYCLDCTWKLRSAE